MTKDLLKIKIEKCFNGRSCSITFDPLDHYGWLSINCGCCVFPEDIDRLRKFLFVSTISSVIDYDSYPLSSFVEIYCCYDDVIY